MEHRNYVISTDSIDFISEFKETGKTINSFKTTSNTHLTLLKLLLHNFTGLTVLK